MSGDMDRLNDEKQPSPMIVDHQNNNPPRSAVTQQHAARHSTRRVGYAMSQAPRHRRASGNADFAVSSTYQQQIAAAAMAAAASQQQCYPVPFFIQQNGPGSAAAAANGFDTQFVTYPAPTSHLEAPFLFYDGKSYSIIPASMIPSTSSFNHLGYFLTPAGPAAFAPQRTAYLPDVPTMVPEQQAAQHRIAPVETSDKAVQVNLAAPTTTTHPIDEYWPQPASQPHDDDEQLCKRVELCSLIESSGYNLKDEDDQCEKCSTESYDGASFSGSNHSDEKTSLEVWSTTTESGATFPAPNNEEVAATAEVASPIGELDVSSRQQPVRPSNVDNLPPQTSSSNHRKSWASLFKPGGQTPVTVATNGPASDNVVVQQTVHGSAVTPWCVPKVNVSSARYNPRYKIVPNDFIQLGGFFRGFECRQSAPALTPRGFYNSGNYCYVNSVLQALLACPMFFNFIGSLPNLRDAGTLPSSSEKDNDAEESAKPENAKKFYAPTFISQVKQIFDSFSPMQRTSQSARGLPMYRRNQPELKVGDALHIEDFHRLADTLWRNKTLGQQEDAHEFLCHLLYEIHNECLLCMKLASSNSPSKENKNTEEMDGENADEDDSEWQEYYGKRVHIHREVQMDATPISEIFAGCFRTSLERGGSTTSSNMEPFYSLSLDGESLNLVQSLKALNSRVPVAGLANPITKKPTKAYQSMMIEKLPPCLVLHLKCFVWNKPNGVRKVFPRMTIPVDLTVPQEIMSRTSSSPRCYKLFAVIHHRGKSVNNGHYICDVFHPGLPGWIRCDDQRVTVVHSREVLLTSSNGGSDDRSSDLSPFILLYRQQ